MSSPAEMSLARARANIDRALAAWQARPSGVARIERIGLGFTNYNFRVIWADGLVHFVKSPGEETGAFIDKKVAVDASIKVGKLGVSPAVLYVDPETGVEIYEFLQGYRGASLTDFYDRDILERTVTGYRLVHGSTQFLSTATGFAQIGAHRDSLKALCAPLPDALGALDPQLSAAQRAIEASGIDITGCYNDAHITNYMIGPQREVKIIDWEYASNNDPIWDLGSLAFETFMTDARQQQLVEIYCGAMRQDIAARLYLYMNLAMVKWAHWALLQARLSALPYDFNQYARFLIMRAQAGMTAPRWDNALEKV